MEVNSVVTGANDLSKVNEVKQEKQNKQKEGVRQLAQQQTIANQTDKLEISDEAKRMQEIKTKIENGYYKTSGVLEETAKKIFDKINK